MVSGKEPEERDPLLEPGPGRQENSFKGKGWVGKRKDALSFDRRYILRTRET